ncbi:hypothetical protein PENSPDRAFT_417738 [Peniophora sp. CONT]|nr:hypothetical protein PENSPDRAFT_417738 [Peniophora sp. CONT]
MAMAWLKGLVLLLTVVGGVQAKIDRQAIVRAYNPTRGPQPNATTPLQVGNGNIAFGADISGLQTFLPFNTLSSWGWKNDSLPAGKTQADIENYEGTSWPMHGREVRYDFGGDPAIETWLTSNPNRVNLARLGLVFLDDTGATQNISMSDLDGATQTLDLWTGVLTSTFSFNGLNVSITTTMAQDTDVLAISLSSDLLSSGRLGLFVDFPWCDGSNKFNAPFVGVFNATLNHTSALDVSEDDSAVIRHTMVNNTFLTTFGGDAFNVTRDDPAAHRYTLLPSSNSPTFSISVGFSLSPLSSLPSPGEVVESSENAWANFWENSGFVDVVSGSTDERANELQRRIVLSRYLERVNEAGDNPPQESGLTNNGWYGKFHMEMFFWHSAHWALWGNWDLLDRATGTYHDFMTTSIERAQVQQGFKAGARWPKMTDPTGRSSPGTINNLLIWEQPHPIIFATYALRAANSTSAQQSAVDFWKDIVVATADFMTAYAWKNESSGYFDLGPPMYVVSEDTSPNVTTNPAFELTYFRLTLSLASNFMQSANESVPDTWTSVLKNLAPLPIQDGLYAVYEGIEENWWDDAAFTSDHPSLAGLVGWLPPVPGLDLAMANATTRKVWETWHVDNLYGWDFPLLALSAARLGSPSQAIDFLLDPLFEFDDAGYPTGGTRVPTPYFPSSGSFLYAVAAMAAGWDGVEEGREAPGFPEEGWMVAVEGVSRVL